ncbi:cytidine deaminase [Deinococcus peraridilitoris]|uniref:Cytidine deaminase n=1 Tax=Deinococcus peraridilitoris (strain DSM 19664 / LMG 22246 / CIP 109416 / KR-200) TaxID=937777 RepID=K9ZYL1_DEIPD|nr:cytidine deaminase [Deinococcus peraridilitoris]AFZ65845.1 cytidine deaminase, homotetrameric [Deinococcus peraridilitoris DSM 19664]
MTVDQQTADAELLSAAQQAYHNAYAPYSKFGVGAALRTPTGEVFAGANVENASYGLGRCAEQSAVQAMATTGQRTFTEVVVYSEASPPASPCGACRQVLFEFAPEAQVTCVNHLGEVLSLQVKELLPHGFRLGE